jgi:hypothetical protein
LFVRMHGDGDHQHGRAISEGLQAVRQEHTQSSRDWLHPVVLKEMNQRAELTLVAAIRYRFDERRGRQAARLAKLGFRFG